MSAGTGLGGDAGSSNEAVVAVGVAVVLDAGVAAVRLQHVDAAFVQIRQHAPDRAVTFAGGHRDFD